MRTVAVDDFETCRKSHFKVRRIKFWKTTTTYAVKTLCSQITANVSKIMENVPGVLTFILMELSLNVNSFA